MVSGSFVALCAAGFAGSLFLGYCVYFDKKRRSDPDYKKKVLASEMLLMLGGINMDERPPPVIRRIFMVNFAVLPPKTPLRPLTG